jgi:hypothetical protein
MTDAAPGTPISLPSPPSMQHAIADLLAKTERYLQLRPLSA